MRRLVAPAGFLASGVVLALVPIVKLPAFYESFLYLVFFWIALATSWNILSGYSGYFSFGHGAFFGAGVYTTATLATWYGVPFLWTLPASGLTAALLGTGIAAIVFRVSRLRGELFALLTLAVTFILATIVLNTKIDGGPGVFLSAVPIPPIFGSPTATLYTLSLSAALLAVWAARAIYHSRWGLGLFAIHDDEDVAEVMGIPTYRYKLFAFALSCFIAGFAGGIQAMFVTYVTVAETFSVVIAVDVVLMSILGGTRYWFGPALGAVIVTVLTHALAGGETAVLNRAMIGAILIIVIVFLPQGVAGKLVRRRARQALPAAAGQPAVVGAGGGNPAPRAAGSVLLSCSEVRKAFRGVQALAGVSLDVREGEILGLVGPNGSGKSTLINVVSGHYRLDAGRIVFAGSDIARLDGHRIAARGLSRTYQIPRPFRRLTVFDNVAVAAMFGQTAYGRGVARREVQRWLDFTGLGNRGTALPDELNLHQRKLLELARALASQPRLVLLDEVLAGLTPAEMADAARLIREIRDRGTTVVFVEHVMRVVVDLTDRVIVLNYGQVIAEGAPRDVMRHPDVVKAYLGKAYA